MKIVFGIAAIFLIKQKSIQTVETFFCKREKQKKWIDRFKGDLFFENEFNDLPSQSTKCFLLFIIFFWVF